MAANLTINQIYNQILTAKAAQSALNGLNNTSQSSIWNGWAYLTAMAIWTQTSLWSLFQSNTETAIANAPAWTPSWVQAQSFAFQYSSSVPQVIQLNSNFVPAYPVTNTSLQIISRASVTTQPDRIVSVKVATNNPPQALSSGQTLSFTGYLNDISPAGVQYNVVSLNADQAYINANILYNGQYASVIQANVLASINNYMANIEFDGYFRLSTLETYILNTSGVTDVEFLNVAVRPDLVPISGTTYLVQNSTELINKVGLFSGYVIPETTGGYTLPGTLNFIIGS